MDKNKCITVCVCMVCLCLFLCVTIIAEQMGAVNTIPTKEESFNEAIKMCLAYPVPDRDTCMREVKLFYGVK